MPAKKSYGRTFDSNDVRSRIVRIVSANDIAVRIRSKNRPSKSDKMFHEVLRKASLYISVEGTGNRTRFAHALRHVWLTIPCATRATILTSWRKGFADEPWIPRILIQDIYSYVGACENFGALLDFNSRVIDGMPLQVLTALIAHELSHAWHFLEPRSFANKLNATWLEREGEADHLAETWGFAMTGLRKWATTNGEPIKAATGNPNTRW